MSVTLCGVACPSFLNLLPYLYRTTLAQPACSLSSFVPTSLQGKIFSLLERKMERDVLLFLNHRFLFGRTGYFALSP